MCSIECHFKLGVSAQKDPWLSKLVWILGANAAAWLVSLGGLAAVQDTLLAASTDGNPQLSGIAGFSGDESNKAVLRYYWFIAAFEVVVLALSAVVVMTGSISKYRGTVVGLLSVATLLYFQFANASYGLRSLWTDGIEKDRVNAMLAGVIMTSTVNSISLFSIGWETVSSKTAEVSLAVDK